jgi:hypothetical protein
MLRSWSVVLDWMVDGAYEAVRWMMMRDGVEGFEA